MLTDAVLHLIQVYNVSIILLLLNPYLIYFLKSKSFDVDIDRKYVLLFFCFSIFFIFLFLFIDLASYENSVLNLFIIRQSSELLLINLFVLFIYLYFMSYFWRLLFFKSIHIDSNLPSRLLKDMISKTNNKMSLQIYHNSIRSNSIGYVPGSFFTRFEVNLFFDEERKKGFELFLFNSLRNYRILTIFSLISILPLILVRSQAFNVSENITETEILIFYFQNFEIDTVFWFVGGLLLIILFGITLASIQENLLIEYEDNFKNVKLRDAIELPNVSIKKPDIQLDNFKDQLAKKKEESLKLFETKKNEEIKRIMGEKIESNKDSINPETIRLDALIRSIKNILISTPIHREVSLDEILSVINIKANTSPEEIEAIIIGLLSKGDVKGEYDIWRKRYMGGTTVQRFISKYLVQKNSINRNIEAFKVKTDGSLEIHFNTEGKKQVFQEEEGVESLKKKK